MPCFNQIATFADWAKNLEQPVVLTIGFFDGLHRGHVQLLRQLRLAAQAFGAEPVVLTFANSPRGYHQPDRDWLYLTTPAEKLLLIAKHEIEVILMLNYGREIAEQTAIEFLTRLGQLTDLRALVVGYDSRLGCDQIAGRPAFLELSQALGIDLVYVEPVTESGRAVKSREVRDLIAKGDVQTARHLLGHPYIICEQVQHGKGRGGQRLGVPTANLLLPRQKLAPPTGVYACRVICPMGEYPAAVCVMSAQQAHRTVLEREAHLVDLPTEEHLVVVEAHLIGFTGDLYGATIVLEFHAQVRGWIEFKSSAELQEQLVQDIQQTRAFVDFDQNRSNND